MDNILFARVNLPLLNKQRAVRDILEIDPALWFWDDYRATSMLPLMTVGAEMGARGASNNRRGNYEWTKYTPSIVKEWFEDVVFPWMGQRTRIMALKTIPRFANKEHIDCDPHRMGTQQHKFRVVLQGQTDTLYFITKQGIINAPTIEESFIMDGSWPHGMDNTTDQFKLTLAAGAPWNGNQSYNNINEMLVRSDYDLPDNYKQYFNTPR